jgi:hypothetical protein
MPFMLIYQLPDGKWHVWRSGERTSCGKPMSASVKTRKIAGTENSPDPPAEACCLKCFSFLSQTVNSG